MPVATLTIKAQAETPTAARGYQLQRLAKLPRQRASWLQAHTFPYTLRSCPLANLFENLHHLQ